MPIYNLIVEVIVNVLRIFLIKSVIELFFKTDPEEENRRRIGFIIYYLCTTILYSLFHISFIYEIFNCLGFIGLTLLYHEKWKKRIWVSLVLFSMDMACSLIVLFTFEGNGQLQQPAIQVMLLLICVTMISRITYPTNSQEEIYQKDEMYILILIPAASVFVLCILLYGKIAGAIALLICVAMLIINMCVFYLYQVMVKNHINQRNNDIYVQQINAYQNQLEVIMESQNRIRSLKHDMKNHMLAMQALLQKNKIEEATEYFVSMQNFMTNPLEYVTTGNDSIDSLLNYKIQKANNILKKVEVKINIPEGLRLHSFDLNVILGNLLDNATEAALQTKEKLLKIMINLDKGILYMNICNSYQEIMIGENGEMKTTKPDTYNHGMGLKNVGRIVEKYHGEMDFSYEKGLMEVEIIVYLKDM